ncbi:MAG: family hydrolase [Verrucomicrobiales bacterium]|nr:family hydrolase [Verrucomicrobiales bacterium]
MASRYVKGKVKPFNNIQAVTFDVGGTLIEPFPSVGHVYAEVAARHGFKNVSAELLNHNFAAAWQARKNFNHTRTDWSNLVNRTFAGVLPQAPSEEFFEDLFQRFTQPDCWKICDDVLPTLEELRVREIRLAVISNWDERLRVLLPRLDLSSYFEAIVVSCEVGFPKPSGVIFEYAARKLGLPPQNILHVGDSATEDVEGARNAGFAAVLLARNSVVKDSISSLRQLTALF